MPSFRGRTHAFLVPRNLAEAARAIGRAEESTLFMSLLAIFQVLLSRYCDEEDIAVGTPIANRTRAEIEPLVGFFVNSLVLRTDLSGDPPFRELLARVRETSLGAYAHQDVPFEKLVEELSPDRDPSREPFFQVMFALQNAPMPEAAVPGGLTLRPMEIDPGTSKFDLSLHVWEHGEGLLGVLEYSTDLFEQETILRMVGHLSSLLGSVAENPSARLSELSMLGEGERRQLLEEWTRTWRSLSGAERVEELFERQVRKSPDRMAVVGEGLGLSYGALEESANGLARRLRELGVGVETRVGICLDGTVETLVGILAVLKAGGAYVPLETSYPRERLGFMAMDAGASVIVGREATWSAVGEGKAERVDLEAESGRWGGIGEERGLSSSLPGSGGGGGSLAYVMYTSGSTGRPKGVAMTHGSLVNLLEWQRESFLASEGGSEGRRTLQFASLGFDVSFQEIFSTWVSGGTLVLASTGERRDPSLLWERIEGEGVDRLFVPFVALQQLAEWWSGGGERRTRRLEVITAGEQLQVTRAVSGMMSGSSGGRLENQYGPTEAHVVSSHVLGGRAWEWPELPPIGRPIWNTRLYVLDRYGSALPVGIPGELHIGGRALARGYLGRPELTAERFVPDGHGVEPGSRVYATGDRARWRKDGELEFLGRVDAQVKIRGYRIEPGEVEAVLAEHPRVAQAVVVARAAGRTSRRLVAYCTPVHSTRGEPLNAVEVSRYLAERLPEFMVPSAVVILDEFPLTPTGKIDRRALPAPEVRSGGREQEGEAPPTPVEAELAEVWAEVLGVERVGLNENFFELGGDSILSIQVVARAHQRGLSITPSHMFEYPTVAELATVAGSGRAVRARQDAVVGEIPLTPIQCWFFAQDLPEEHHWNMAIFVEVRERLDGALLRSALARVLRHHDALRLRFERNGSVWRQRNAGPEAAPVDEALHLIDLRDLPEPGRKSALERIASDTQASLDLSAGPLARLLLFRVAPRSDRLLFVIHHLGVDGVSWRILLEDLLTAYQQLVRGVGVEFLPKTTSFLEWSELLSEYAGSDEVAAEIPYWRALLDGGSSPIPVDFPDGANDVASQEAVIVALSIEETRALLQDAPRAYRTQINDALLTAFVKAFTAWTGESSLLLDLEGHGREELFEGVDLSRTVGWFTSLFPVRLVLPQGDPGAALVAVKEQLRAIPHRGVGYGVLRYLRGDGELAARLESLKPEVSFNYLGQFDNLLPEGVPFRLAPESQGPLQSPRGQRPHLLYVTGGINGGMLQMVWAYSRNVHRRETVERIAADFMASLRELVTHCQSPEARGVSPSDFPLVALDQAAVDRLVPKDDPIEDIYPLSSLQLGLLFHAMYTPGSRLYFQQFVTTFRGDLDVPAFRRVWQRVVDRHPILRTAFAWEGLPEPVQIVHESAEIPWDEQDWRHIPEGERQVKLDAFLEEDQQRGLVLTRPPLMRITLVHLESDCWQIVWSFHHLILDGWSLPLLLNEVMLFYEGFARGHEIALPRPRPFRDYIAWLGRQDLASAERYWREVLRGFDAPTPLGIDRPGETGWTEGDRYGQETLLLTEEATATLTQFARAHRLTLNTLLQGAWALLLGYYSGRDDVVYGTTVSGRPPSLGGVESMIGLFINMLPVRTRIDAAENVVAWLQRLQASQARMREHEFTPLALIQRWSDLPSGAPMFESTLAFENYPVDSSFREHLSLTVENVRHLERTNYPLVLMAASTTRLTVWLRYNRRRIDPSIANRLLEHLEALLLAVGERPDARPGELQRAIMAMDEKQRMEERERRASSRRKKFREIAARPVKTLGGDLIEAERLNPERPLPLVMRPAVEDIDLVDWASAHLPLLQAKLSEHGAILFRGFDLPEIADFERFANAVCSGQLFEEYGDLPREEVGSKVYGSTVYPADKSILFHNESSHMHRWPMRILFYCKLAAVRGGETPLLDCRETYRRLDPALRERFREQGVLYVRNFTDGLDVAWQTFFRTTDRAEVERFCRENAMEYEWKKDGSLRVLQRRPAIATHPGTGDVVFFNQILLHHPSCLDPEVRESLLSLYDERDLPRNVLYGDGQPIEDEVISGLGRLYRDLAVTFPWETGDVLLVDNMLTAHARNPFGGPRKILVALGQMTAGCNE
jgi:amino acid adenylation domain-containing protein/non-ribosomal peptide synthase protein (TIGR01720 family)